MDLLCWFRKKGKMFSFLLWGGGLTLFSSGVFFFWKCLSCTLQCDSWSSKINFIIDITTQCRGSHDVRDAVTIYNLTSISSSPHLSPSPEVRAFLSQKKQPQKTIDINWSLKTLTRYCVFFKWVPFKCLPLLSPKNLLQSPTPVCGWSACNWHFWISIVPQRSNGLNVSKSVQKCPMCPKVLTKSIHHLSDIVSLNLTS